MDSIIELSYQTVGVPVHQAAFGNVIVYPNPAVDQFSLSYQLKEAGTALISIFNNTGQLMEMLGREHMQAGEYRLVRNIAGYRPGVYYCRVQMGNEMVTKKIVKVN
jgi:hypothetical protein